MATSRRHLNVLLAEGTSAAQFEALVTNSGCIALAGQPRIGLFRLECPDGTSAAHIRALNERLGAEPIVESVLFVIPAHAKLLPKPTWFYPKIAPEPGEWTWGEKIGGANWGLERIAAPLAWNLNPAIARRVADGQGLTKVLVMDLGFVDGHSDLPRLSLVNPVVNASATAPNHGTVMAGIIGATWGNGEYTDGTSPFAQMRGYVVSGIDDAPTTELGEWKPRIVNLSLGLNIKETCRHRLRCKKSEWARLGVANGCDPTKVHQEIAKHALVFARRVADANQDPAAPTLFVAAAGNESGTRSPSGRGNEECDAEGDWGRTDFPAKFASSFVWAHDDHPDIREHVLVVEALSGPEGAYAFKRAPYSNPSVGGVFAPGERLAGPAANADGSVHGVRNADGTSSATALVSGAAAFLLAVEPRLSNAEVKTLLTELPFSQDAGGGKRYIDLFNAVVGICRLPRFAADCAVHRMLADIDDGTADGFTLFTGSDHNDQAQWHIEDAGGDGRVDLRDFRRLRDAYLLYTSIDFLESNYVEDLIDSCHPKLDLNRDGVFEDLKANWALPQGQDDPRRPTAEMFPRTGFTQRARMHLNGSRSSNLGPTARTSVRDYWSRRRLYHWGGDPSYYLDESSSVMASHWRGRRGLLDVEVFMKAYQGDALQPWPADALPGLLASADLRIDATDALAALQADTAELSIEGLVAPDVHTIDVPADSAPYTDLRLPSGQTEAVLTTHFNQGVVLKWRPICEDGTAAWSGPHVIELGNLKPGEDRAITLVPPNCSVSCAGRGPGPDCGWSTRLTSTRVTVANDQEIGRVEVSRETVYRRYTQTMTWQRTDNNASGAGLIYEETLTCNVDGSGGMFEHVRTDNRTGTPQVTRAGVSVGSPCVIPSAPRGDMKVDLTGVEIGPRFEPVIDLEGDGLIAGASGARGLTCAQQTDAPLMLVMGREVEPICRGQYCHEISKPVFFIPHGQGVGDNTVEWTKQISSGTTEENRYECINCPTSMPRIPEALECAPLTTSPGFWQLSPRTVSDDMRPDGSCRGP